MTNLLSRLERMVAAVELPRHDYQASVRIDDTDGYRFRLVQWLPSGLREPATQVVPHAEALEFTMHDVRKLVLGLVAKLGGDAPVAEVGS